MDTKKALYWGAGILLFCLICYECALCPPRQTWVFAITGLARPGSYLNASGMLEGFDLDMIRQVCKIANRKCDFTIQPYTECAMTLNDRWFPAIGLMSEWFHACPWWYITRERENSVDFSAGYKTSSASKFAVSMNNPRGFNPLHVQGRTIALVVGFVSSSLCLEVNQYIGATYVLKRTANEAVQAVVTGEADAFFTSHQDVDNLMLLPSTVQCAPKGTGIMAKKGLDFTEWWDPAFQVFVNCGCYHYHCNNATALYGAPMNCLSLQPTATCPGYIRQNACPYA